MLKEICSKFLKTGCFVGWEGEKIKFSILTTTRLSEDVVLWEDCEAWGKSFHMSKYIS